MTATTRLVLATGNAGKAREMRSLLPLSFDVVTAVSLGLSLPEETGTTFEENARLKAITVSRAVPDLVLADDSGLEVAVLDGRPGVRSARYAGERADDAANLQRVLEELVGRPAQDRAARFVCCLCLARSGAVLAIARGESDGRIADQPRGAGGFGYDPVFVTPDGRTMAELDPDEKNRISHRGAALSRMVPILLTHRPDDHASEDPT
jgi:XTP/dITP diphosphohydrolase